MNRVEYTKTDFVNLALSQLGSERLQVADITSETGVIPDIVNQFFAPTLEEVTAIRAWNCCLKTMQLSDATTSSVGGDKRDLDISDGPLMHMSHAYILPDDAIRVYMAYSGTGSNYKGMGIDFEVNHRVLQVNQADPIIVYSAVPENTTNAGSKPYTSMDSLFARCFYTLLGARMCYAITGSAELESALLDEFYNIVLPDAERCDSIEGVQLLKSSEDNRQVRVNTYTTFEKV